MGSQGRGMAAPEEFERGASSAARMLWIASRMVVLTVVCGAQTLCRELLSHDSPAARQSAVTVRSGPLEGEPECS